MEAQFLNAQAASFDHSKEFSRQQNLKQMQNSYIQEILTEQQEQIRFEMTVEELHFRYQVNKAKMYGSKLDLLLVIHRFVYWPQIPYKDKVTAQRQWLVDFYQKQANIHLQSGFFCPKIDIGLAENSGNINPKLLLVSGIDLLETHNIINRYFRQDPKVSWIDASHCLLNFQNEGLVKEFLQNQIVNKEELAKLPTKDWLQIKGYKFMDIFERRIFVRYCTEADESYIAALQKNDSIYQNFKRANRKLQYDLLQNHKLRLGFEKIIAEDIVNQMVGPNCFRKKKKSTIDKMTGDRSSFIYHPDTPRGHEQHYEHTNIPTFAQSNNDQKYRYSLDYYKKNFIPQLKSNNASKSKPKQKKKDPAMGYVPDPVTNWRQKLLQRKKKINHQFNPNKPQGFHWKNPAFFTLFTENDIVSEEDRKKMKINKRNQCPQIDTSFHFDDLPQNPFQSKQPRDDVNFSFQQEEMGADPYQEDNKKMNNNRSHHNTFQKGSYQPYGNYWQQNINGNFGQYYFNPQQMPQVGNSGMRYNSFMPRPPQMSQNTSSIPQRSNHFIPMNNFSISNELISSNSHPNRKLSPVSKDNHQKPFSSLNGAIHSLGLNNPSNFLQPMSNSAVQMNRTSTSGIVSDPSQNSSSIRRQPQENNKFFQKLLSIKNANPNVFLQPEVKTEWPFKPTTSMKPVINQAMNLDLVLQKLQERQSGLRVEQNPHFLHSQQNGISKKM